MEIKASEMPLQQDGSVYHLNLHPEELAHKIILVGDPGRVSVVSNFFDEIEVKKQNREILTHTGWCKGKRISVLSTGMGTDNIDIVMNELDALVNIDLKKRQIKQKHTPLEIVRIGTCGILQKNIETDSFIASQYGFGLDGLLHTYKHDNISDEEMVDAFIQKCDWDTKLSRPYAVACSQILIDRLAKSFTKGITVTSQGFYAPQCRVLRQPLAKGDFIQPLEGFSFRDLYFTNMEMETSALYAFGKMLGHEALTICVGIANRVDKTFSQDYNPAMKSLIEHVLTHI